VWYVCGASRTAASVDAYRGFLPKAFRLGIGQTIGLMVFRKCLGLFGAEEKA
jgi:hypothetical protein